MKVTQSSNGQITVEHENLKIIQTIISEIRFNEAYMYHEEGDYYEAMSEHDSRFSPLFIALHNFKCRF